ncbi:glutathione S-transferase family protein [Pseudolabrys taiwanensis]|uniref:Glutathione S-transferase family protein n=1 Tax=Pseudolabrys taiwanensis TaxID=331696 RepID=A0A345ZTD5_9HYPH|nr:glutathione S-transferase family protein [Pseudolabrys taiwanensis]AXK80182.1 glutathione S-transferase family protein [Pseudolabrys taiwanensis]
MLTLYNAAHSTCSQKVRICLAEKKLPFKDVKLDIGKAKEHLRPEYLKINPNGVVPTLVDDDEIIVDSSVICEYLEERYPEVRLSPENLADRARMRAWMRFLEEVPTAAVRVPSFNMGFLPRYEGMDRKTFEGVESDVRPIRKQFYRRMGPQGFKKEDVEASYEQIANTCSRMNAALEKGPWLLGEQYTLADIIVAPLIDRMADLGMDTIWNEKFPRVADWYERMKARPAFQQTFYPGARMSEFLPLAPAIKEETTK